MQNNERKEELERRLHDVQKKLGNEGGGKKRKHSSKSGGSAPGGHNAQQNKQVRSLTHLALSLLEKAWQREILDMPADKELTSQLEGLFEHSNVEDHHQVLVKTSVVVKK